MVLKDCDKDLEKPIETTEDLIVFLVRTQIYMYIYVYV